MEAVLAEMELANSHLENLGRELIELLMDDQRSWTREKAQERLRAKLAPAQTTLSAASKAKASRGRGRGLEPVKIGPTAEEYERAIRGEPSARKE